MAHWNPYEPCSSAPWDVKRVCHLHRRVVFGACWNEIQRDLNDAPQAAVTRVLNGTCRIDGLPKNFEALAATIGDAAADSGSLARLKAWWIYRCLFSPRPLEERLTLMWHNHFATSNSKVNNLRLMKKQNETLRKYALSPFGELLQAMSHDPALLQWLDAPSNRVGAPNENLAREIMELFSLGIGHYTERDIAEAARALTGWTVREGIFQVSEEHHDAGQKTILNQTGDWTGDDVVRILLGQKACANRIAWRLTDEFFGESVVSEAALSELADGLRERNLDVRWGIETILRSELFFSDANIQSRVADPVSFLIIPLRSLEFWRFSPSTMVLADWLDKMGQALFYPPNVGGWNGGRRWLTTRTIIARANYAAALSSGMLSNPARRLAMPAALTAMPDTAQQIRLLGEMLCGQSNLPQMTERPNLTADSNEHFQQCIRELVTRAEAQLH